MEVALNFLKGVLRTPRGGISAVILLIVISCAIFAEFIAPYDYAIQNLPGANVAPSATHLLGTD